MELSEQSIAKGLELLKLEGVAHFVASGSSKEEVDAAMQEMLGLILPVVEECEISFRRVLQSSDARGKVAFLRSITVTTDKRTSDATFYDEVAPPWLYEKLS